ncbi:MAG: Hsp20/alpha crystallin family protein [Bacteroidales bacterium]|nr:Hsp20/alpha crystallin family protein [Bacteroidales bacterium]
MAYLRFYSPYHSAYRDENTNESLNRIMQHYNADSDCGCCNGSVPASNISESEKEFRIEMALPGVDKKNINLKHEKGYLTISVEKPQTENQDNYLRQEFDYSGTSRTYRIGEKIDAEGISAQYENGLLIVHLPKKEVFAGKSVQSIVVE